MDKISTLLELIKSFFFLFRSLSTMVKLGLKSENKGKQLIGRNKKKKKTFLSYKFLSLKVLRQNISLKGGMEA